VGTLGGIVLLRDGAPPPKLPKRHTTPAPKRASRPHPAFTG
jgi:hypothetical protein